MTDADAKVMSRATGVLVNAIAINNKKYKIPANGSEI
jgi:hypothetical protein